MHNIRLHGFSTQCLYSSGHEKSKCSEPGQPGNLKFQVLPYFTVWARPDWGVRISGAEYSNDFGKSAFWIFLIDDSITFCFKIEQKLSWCSCFLDLKPSSNFNSNQECEWGYWGKPKPMSVRGTEIQNNSHLKISILSSGSRRGYSFQRSILENPPNCWHDSVHPILW